MGHPFRSIPCQNPSKTECGRRGSVPRPCRLWPGRHGPDPPGIPFPGAVGLPPVVYLKLVADSVPLRPIVPTGPVRCPTLSGHTPGAIDRQFQQRSPAPARSYAVLRHDRPGRRRPVQCCSRSHLRLSGLPPLGTRPGPADCSPLRWHSLPGKMTDSQGWRTA